MGSNDNSKGEQITNKQIWFGILFIIILTSGYILADFLISKNNGKQEIVIPDNENIFSSSTIDKKLKEVSLLKNPYSPPQDIYSNSTSYNKYLTKLAMIGEFEVANLYIKGSITNDLLNFISINIGPISGTLGADRKTSNTLDLDNTTAAFSKNNPIDLTINLKESVKLSTTKEEFLSTFQTSKSVVLWNYIAPPPSGGTIAKILIAPYSQNGKYGDGTTIEDVKLLYECKKGSDCKAQLCPDKNYTYGSECINDLFGPDSSKNYSDYFKN
jgi:hypothetical protein